MQLLKRCVILAVLAASVGILAAADVPATAPAPTHDALVTMYLDGKWDDLEKALATVKDAALPPAERAENLIIRQALAECRPPWWKTIKLGKKVPFSPRLWGRGMTATYDPAATNLQLSVNNGQVTATLGWPVADMDNPAQAEHGFTKGELLDLGIWNTLGTADAWGSIPVSEQANLDDPGKLRLGLYGDFRGDLSGVFYGSPRARRWGLWLYLAMYMDKYKDMQIVASRRAVAILLITEVVSHPEKYPTLKLPADWKDSSESKIADKLRAVLEKTRLPLPEDKALRDALKAFATANELPAFRTNEATLPNKLKASFDPKLDEPLRTKREAWIKDTLTKAAATKPG